MIDDLKDFVIKIDIRGRKTKRYLLICSGCGKSHYDMKSRVGRQCRGCSRRNDKTVIYVAWAKQNGGVFLDTEWKGTQYKYSWQCKEGHEWKSSSNIARRQSWCKVCSLKDDAATKRIKNITYCQELAASNQGLFLSTEYKNDATKYLWQCGKGHKWNTRLTVVESGSWCPVCFVESSSWRRSENNLRRILETIYNKPFHSARPDWLRNPSTGYPLELDCYNEELRLAVEYDGELHQHDVAFFNNSSSQQRERDIIKDKLCKERGIILIRISYKDKKQLKKSVLEALDGLV